jgi:uncharacterized membrane protein YqjE
LAARDGQRQGWQSVEDKSLGDIVTKVSENASLLVREEVELAKAEVEEKVQSIARGSAVGAVAGFFVFMGLIFLLIGVALALDDLLNNAYQWAGFFIVAAALFVFAGLGAWFAVRSLKRGTPPTPDQAIEEARLIRETMKHPDMLAPTDIREEEIRATGRTRD